MSTELFGGELLGAVLVAQHKVRNGDATGGKRNRVHAGLAPIGVFDRCFVAEGLEVFDSDRDVQQYRG